MKHLIHLIIAFILGLGIGAYYGRNTVSNKVVEVATQVYENGLDAAVASGTTQLKGEGQKVIDELKEQGKKELQNAIKKQIDGLFN